MTKMAALCIYVDTLLDISTEPVGELYCHFMERSYFVKVICFLAHLSRYSIPIEPASVRRPSDRPSTIFKHLPL